MRSCLLVVSTLLLLGAACGCQRFHPKVAANERSAANESSKKFVISTRNNALALLDELLNEEKHLSKLLLIKRESTELNRLVKDISEAAGAGADQLKALKKSDPAFAQAATALPMGEKATRESIAKAKQDLLLHASGAELEFQLLLTQAEALNYAAHLALVAAENEPRPEQAREFFTLSLRLKTLHGRVLVMLRKQPG
jgi:hypothetical protein